MSKKLVFIVTTILLLISFSAQAKLIAYYPMEGNANDMSGDGVPADGILTGSPTFVAGKIGQAISLNGSQWVNLQNPTKLNPTAQITLSAWIYPTNYGNSAYHVIIAKGDTSYTLQHGNGNNNEFMIYNTTWRVVQAAPPGGMASMNNGWHHLAGTFDGTTMIEYLDGEPLGNPTVITPPINVNTNNLYIGGSSTATGRTFTGMIDDVQIYDTALTQAEIKALMAGISQGAASGPNPADGDIEVPLDVTMTWKAGKFAATHNVYIGTDFDDVNNGTTPTVSGLTDTSYAPAGLTYNTVYYWRVDEVNAPPTQSQVFKGKTWSFLTELEFYPVEAERFTTTASSQFDDAWGPANVTNRSGLSNDGSVWPMDDKHSVNLSDMWISANNDTNPSITITLDKIYKMKNMLVWNYNGVVVLPMLGIHNAILETTTDGTTWQPLGSSISIPQAPGSSDDAATTVDLASTAMKALRIKPTSNWSGAMFPGLYGLSEILMMRVPTHAVPPISPADGTINVDPSVTLTWTAAPGATSHNVYVGIDSNAVLAGDAALMSASSVTSLAKSVEMQRKYYWRVDEVIGSDTWKNNSPYDIWDFNTPAFLVVDDIERYPNTTIFEDANQIYNIWADGFNNSTVNGALLGNQTGNPLTTAGVHGGTKAVTLFYDNTGTHTMSEISVDPAKLLVGNNWTKGGAKTLTVWFFGDPNNNPTTSQVYVKINGKEILYTGSADNMVRARWNQWNIDLASQGITQNNVTAFAIGIKKLGGGSAGRIILDDIRLYRDAPAAVAVTAVNPGTAGLLAYYAMETNVADTSGNNRNGTVVATPTYAAGKTGYGQAIVLASSAAVNLGVNPAFNPTGSFSVSAWIKPTLWATSNGNTIASNNSGSFGWAITRAATTQLRFRTSGTGGTDLDSGAATLITTSTWTHIACVYDSVAKTKAIYVNGALANQAVVTADITSTLCNTYIGARAGANDTTTVPGNFFTGSLDEVRMYNKALSAAEVEFLSDPTP